MDIEKKYVPSNFEKRIYDNWVQKGYFTPKIDKKVDPFSIVMPPPNITGQLHMGHALDNSIQDAIVRFKRMQGYSTLWLPGTDHASIATEVKIIKQLEEQGINKTDLGREGFLEKAWEWKEQYGSRIVNQMKYLGLSCDWSREAFTMDEQRSKSVLKVFVDLYNKGLIYKGSRMINWCPSCKTALSDAEVEYDEQDSHLWHVRYPFVDGSGEIIIATTRPETILGDTAVAVHPDDARYKDFVGKDLKLPLVDRSIKLIADSYVEIGFGSGAVKITPAHDPNDFEIGERHNLETISVIDEHGIMNENAGKYSGLDRFEVRKRIVEDLDKEGYLVKVEDYKHNVGCCYRCGQSVEPMISQQWFVKMGPLAKPAISAVRKKKIKFVPDRFSKTYYNWMENIKDWCISRQLWWGHRIPAYYCEQCGHMMVSETEVTKCTKCGSTKIHQDEDVLDTWFSSALWPFSTLGYPDNTQDLKYFYPNSMLVTGYDIIFFWVARMIFSGIEHMNDIPFSDVLIHGIVRDKLGRKMSKSLGNGVDPLPIIEKYGADSLRFSLLTGVAPGNDTRFSEEKVESASLFMNKIWNAARFINMHAQKLKLKSFKSYRLTPAEKWILSKLNDLVRDVKNNMDKYELGLALHKIYNFVWNDYCDWFLELVKGTLYGENVDAKVKIVSTLKYTFSIILQLLHPFAPFITEELYTTFNGKNKPIIISSWPIYQKSLAYRDVRQNFDGIVDVIKAIRNIRSEMNVEPSKKIKCYLVIDAQEERWYQNNLDYIKSLAGLSEIDLIQDKSIVQSRYTTAIVNSCEVLISLGDLVDKEKELARLNKEKEIIEKEIKRAEGMLNNSGFVKKAPKNLIDKEHEKIQDYNIKLSKVNEQIILISEN